MSATTHVAEVDLHDYLDGELTPPRARALEDHVSSCRRCAHRLADLADLRTALGALPGMGAPARDLWPGIECRLDPDRSVQVLSVHGAGRPSAAPPVDGGSPSGPGRTGLRRLAYAAGLAAAFAAGALAWRGDGAPPVAAPSAALSSVASGDGPATEAPVRFAASVEVRSAIADLEAILAQGRERLDPATLDVLDRSLATIDAAIAEAEAALARDPSSALLQDLLLSQERTKVRVLTRAATRLLPST